MFLSSAHILPVGSQVRLEIEQEDDTIILYGAVVWVSRVPPALRSVQKEGMGIDFIQVSALVSPLLWAEPPGVRAPANHGSPAPASPGSGASPDPISGDDDPDGGADAAAGPPEGTPVPSFPGSRTDRVRGSAEPVGVARATAPVEPKGGRRYRVELGGEEELRRRFESELKYGGIFVPSTERPDLDQIVSIELMLPRTGPLCVTARVVRHLPLAGQGLEGFAVEFASPGTVVKILAQELLGDSADQRGMRA